MGLLDRAGALKTAADMMRIAREFVVAVEGIHLANNDLQAYVREHSGDVPIDLLNITERMNTAVSAL